MTLKFSQVLISRNYRGDIDMGVIEKFMPMMMEREDDGNMAPIIQVRVIAMSEWYFHSPVESSIPATFCLGTHGRLCRSISQYNRVAWQNSPCVLTAERLCSLSTHIGDSATRFYHTAKSLDKVAHVFPAFNTFGT